MAQAPLLDATQAAFIQGRMAIGVASSSAANEPAVSRGYGCCVTADRRSVTVFVSRRHAQALLADIEAGRGIAVVFTLPSTHETLQLKAPTARFTPVEPGDGEVLSRYRTMFTDELRSLGYTPPYLDLAVPVIDGEAVRLTFEPSDAFVQTPGPSAGTRVERKP